MTIKLLYAIFISGIEIFLLSASITSFLEREKRAGLVFISLFLITLFIVLIYEIYQPLESNVKFGIIVLLSFIIVLFFTPFRRIQFSGYKPPVQRFHEAESVLSRRLLEPGTTAYVNYYNAHPEHQDIDDRSRKNPGLLSENSKFFNPILFRASEVNFTIIEEINSLMSKDFSKQKEEIDPGKESVFIKKWLIDSGAHSVGFCELKDYHLYSHKGRGENSGERIEQNLPIAIAIIVEMDHQSMKHAPQAPTVKESSEQYLNAAILAMKLSLYIQKAGYQAKAHTDGNYEVICPLVAQDSGLGVIGRMGLLMTPRLGPRVRIAVVTTDFPVAIHDNKTDNSAIDFCMICKKCADNCPAMAIPAGPMNINKEPKRWQINSERCYNYWTISGTDCGKCVIVCPYSHPDNWLHTFIKFSIRNNLFFRTMALKLDDIFYGRRPAPTKLPAWLKHKNHS